MVSYTGNTGKVVLFSTTENRGRHCRIVVNTCRVEISSTFYNLSPYEQTCTILGKRLNCDQDDEEYFHLYNVCVKTWQILTRESELLFY